MPAYNGNRTTAEVADGAPQSEVVLGSDLVVARVKLPCGKAMPVHAAEGERIVLVLRGSCRLYLPTGDVTLRAHQMIVIPAGIEYSSEALEETEAIEIRKQTSNGRWTSEEREQNYDPDQYLWGV